MLKFSTGPKRKNAKDPAGKRCGVCDALFTKPPHISWAQWEVRAFCSKSCSNQKPIRQRLEANCVKSADSCWIWTGPTVGTGYGKISIKREGRQSTLRAHRAMFQEVTGIDPVGLVVMHTCDNPPCINPEHLRLGTQADNVADKMAKGRHRNQYGGC